MSNFEHEYKQTLDRLDAAKKKTPENELEGNKVLASNYQDRLVKVSFDVFNIQNDPYDGLWKLEAEGDKQYLVRMDNDAPVETKTGGWNAISNSAGTNVTLTYKGASIQRLSNKVFGFNKEDVLLFKRALLDKVVLDEKFRNTILATQPEERKQELVQRYPELYVAKK